tara:strand:- start:874 stop:1092 length:219 start_codon:yes stop_codon:yes gene_type:complete
MSNKAVFETNSFAVTKEIWQKASNFLGIEKQNSTLQIKRLNPNKVHITKLNGEIIAEFSARVKDHKKLWSLG